MSIDEARRALDRAVEDYLRAAGNYGVVTSWVLVAHMASAEGTGMASTYPMMYMGGEQPPHTVLGLLDIGHQAVSGIGDWQPTLDE